MRIRPLKRLLPQIHIHPPRAQLPCIRPAALPPIPLPHEPRHSRPPYLVMWHKEIPVPSRTLLFQVGGIDELFEPRDGVLLGKIRIWGVGVRRGFLFTYGVAWGGGAVEYCEPRDWGDAGGYELYLVIRLGRKEGVVDCHGCTICLYVSLTRACSALSVFCGGSMASSWRDHYSDV